HRMRARLEEIHLNQQGLQRGTIYLDGMEWTRREPYQEAFENYGLRVVDLPVEDAARRVAASPIRDRLGAPLDDWAAADPARPRHLLAIARRADDDVPWRRQYFDARLRNDTGALLRLAQQPEALTQPPAMICLLARSVKTNSPATLEFLR